MPPSPIPSTARTAALHIRDVNDGWLLLDFLSARFTYHSRDAWAAAMAEGRLILNAATVTAADTRVHTGDHIEYRIPEHPEPDVPRHFVVLHEDDDILVLDKPAGLPCHPAGCFFHNTLWSLLRELRPQACRLALINRLDRETSGIVLVAKTESAELQLRRQFSQRRVEKLYTVIVEGSFPDALTARGWLEPDSDCEVRKKRRFVPAPPECLTATGAAASTAMHEWAVTHFRRLSGAHGTSTLEVKTETGRRHQIRATLCSLGYPVVGDKIYGVDPALFIRFTQDALSAADHAALRLNRQALHASELRFRHPATQHPITVQAPLPAEFLSGVHCMEYFGK